MPAPRFFALSRHYKTAFHNLCSTLEPPSNIKELLWYGLKFDLKSALPKPKLQQCIERLCRDLRIRFHINADSHRTVTDHTGRVLTLKTPDYDPKLYIKSQDYDPDAASPEIETAITAFETALSMLIGNNTNTR